MPNSLTLPDGKQAPLASLTDLAVQINDAHREAEAAMNTGLGYALEAGRLLELAKKQCQHGTWLPWLHKNFKGSKRTAQAYLRLHREYPQLQRKAQRVALLSFRQALVNVANDTHIIYREEEPRRADIIDVWQQEQCQNARRAAARAEVRRTTREVVKPEPEADDEDSTAKAATMLGVSVEMVEKAGTVLESGDQQLIEACERGTMELDEALDKLVVKVEPPEAVSRRFRALIECDIHQWRRNNPTVSTNLLAIVLRAVAADLEKGEEAAQ